MRSRTFGSVFLQTVQVTGLFTALAAGAASDLFDITTDGPDACDVGQIEQWFADSQELIDSAITGAAAEDEASRRYLTTFFGKGPEDDVTDIKLFIDAVKNILNGGLPDQSKGKVRLFCGSSWAVEQSWTDVHRNPTTGLEDEDGTTLEAWFDPDDETKGTYRPFYSEELKQYVLDTPGDYCTRNGGENQAGTSDLTDPSTMTLCLDNIPGVGRDGYTPVEFLSEVTPATTRNSILSKKPQSLVLYHELFHLANGCKDTPDLQYNLANVMLDAKKLGRNPESYVFYTLAYWLGEKNPSYTFDTGSAKRKPKGRRWLDFDYSKLIAYQPPSKRAFPAGSWFA